MNYSFNWIFGRSNYFIVQFFLILFHSRAGFPSPWPLRWLALSDIKPRKNNCLGSWMHEKTDFHEWLDWLLSNFEKKNETYWDEHCIGACHKIGMYQWGRWWRSMTLLLDNTSPRTSFPIYLSNCGIQMGKTGSSIAPIGWRTAYTTSSQKNVDYRYECPRIWRIRRNGKHGHRFASK